MFIYQFLWSPAAMPFYNKVQSKRCELSCDNNYSLPFTWDLPKTSIILFWNVLFIMNIGNCILKSIIDIDQTCINKTDAINIKGECKWIKYLRGILTVSRNIQKCTLFNYKCILGLDCSKILISYQNFILKTYLI